VEVLVVEPHEGQLDALELALLDVLLGGAEAHLADLLPVRIGGRSLVDAGNLQEVGAQVGARRLRQHTRSAGDAERSRSGTALQRGPAGKQIVEFDFHLDSSLGVRADETLYRLGLETNRAWVLSPRSAAQLLF
jgi:hypothetical protein